MNDETKARNMLAIAKKLLYPPTTMIIVMACLFVAFIFIFEQYAYQQAQNRLDEHRRVLTKSLWALDEEMPKAYISLACQNDHYEAFTLYDGDEEFLKVTADAPPKLDKILINLKLITKHTLDTEVIFEGRNIGSISVIWLDRSVYVYGYLLIVCALLIVVVRLYWRVVLAKRTLELRVAERTADLNTANINLREREENLRITMDSIGDAVVATDADGLIIRMNPVAQQITGWDLVNAVGEKASDVLSFVDADTSAPIDDPVSRVVSGETIVGLPEQAALVSKDGRLRLIADSGAPIRDQQGNVVGCVIVFRDVTEERALQEQFRQSQKMEAVGQLAGGVAHDFNNLLTAILGNAEILTLSLKDRKEDLQMAEQIVAASIRAADLTKHLLAFSRKGRMQSTNVDVHPLINEVVDLLSRSIDKRVEIVRDFKADSPVVFGDPTQLENAILNLSVNARDAMPTGGTLTFSTRNVEIDENSSLGVEQQLSPGRYFEMCITDTGVGMSPQVKAHAFEPFFTTKNPGEGTGLGLAAVYGCVKSHNGRITIYSEEGFGTTFKIQIPLAEGQALTRAPRDKGNWVRGTGNILLVDDEDIVRNFAARALADLGYTAAMCSDGLEAIEYFEENHDTIDLVILDLILPKMNGQDVFRRMKEIDPNVPILIASGFAQNAAATTMMNEGAKGFLDKPFRVDELSQEIAEVLQQKRSS